MIRSNDSRRDGEATPVPLDPPAINRLGEILIPSLIMVGELDTTETLVMAEMLVHGIPAARKVVIGDTAHMIPMEKPDLFNKEVLKFLGGL